MKNVCWRHALVLALLSGIADAQANKVTYIYTDPQGTPLLEADVNGNVTATFDYRPYGNIAMGAPTGQPGYTGHVADSDSGMIYMQARYYDPLVGRFLSTDPLGPSPGSIDYFNRFSYVGDNPVARVDPFGRYICKTEGGCDDFDKAYSVLKDASGAYSSHSAEGKAFAKVLGYYGEKGAKNDAGQSVYIKQGATSTGNPAEIGHSAFSGSDTVTFDFAQVKQGKIGIALVEMAASVAHEGQHGVDDASRRKAGISESVDTVRATERNAYRLQPFVNQGLNTNSPYGLWRSDWPEAETETRRQAAVDKYSELSVQNWQQQ